MNLPGYDAWKLATPPDYDGPTCEKCGDFLRRDHTIPGQYWYCRYCDDDTPEAEQ